MISPDVYRTFMAHDLMTFTERAFRELKQGEEFVPAPYLEYLAAKLDAARRGEIRRLIICMPPRHLKSILASVALPAFILGRDPTRSIISVSYGQELADALARDSLKIVRSPWYGELFPRTRLARQAVSDFVTTAGGFRLATSVGGVLTGRGADYIIIDDPLKPEEALSQARRNSVNEWVTNTLLSRLNDQESGVIILVMQRLHMDDVAGRLMKAGGWEVLSLPAVAEEDERYAAEGLLGPLRFSRRQGEVLHPARLSLARLTELQSELGSYSFSGQYQQRPIPLEGNLVKRDWLQRFSLSSPPPFTGVVQSWDTANKSGEFNDYSVGTTWGVLDGRYYLLDVFRQRLEFPDLVRAVTRLITDKGAHTVLIEDRASGTQLIQELRRRGVSGVKAIDPPPGTDKAMRLHCRTTMFSEGRVLVPYEAPWLDAYITELTGFPGLRYDDQVDSTTQALAFFADCYALEVWARL